MIVLLRLNLKDPTSQDLQILTALALHHKGRVGRRARAAFLRIVAPYTPSDSAPTPQADDEEPSSEHPAVTC
jgi:hypothetical protein